MPLFWTFWDRARTLDEKSQVELFKETVIKPHSELFQPNVLVGLTDLDEAIRMFLQRVPPHLETMRSLSRALPKRLLASQKKFRETFADFKCGVTIYFMPSLGAFDGATRTVNGEMALLFGVDVITRIHGEEGFDAFFDHELFHIYDQTDAPVGSGGRPPLYVSLWGEGLATYVSHVLNPKVAENKILGEPKDLAERSMLVLPGLLKELRANLDSTSEDTYRRFFLGRGDGKSEFPPRSGYYVGYLLAQDLAKHHSLRELTRLEGKKLRAEIIASLSRLIKGTSSR